MSKKPVSFFVSYAHSNRPAKEKFMELFIDQTGAAKRFEYSFWQDQDVAVGDEWDSSIQNAIRETQFGLLLVSPKFLGSQYITGHELPHYLESGGKKCFPLMLAQVDFKRQDLKGLEEKQIYRLDSPDFKQPRAFNDLKPRRKEQFTRELFAMIDDWLVENY
jgi:hypothetical protein